MALEINKDLLSDIELLISSKNDDASLLLLGEEHPADIAEILDQLNLNNATYLFKILDSEKTADVLMEIDEDDREKILRNLSAEEIAEEIDELETDDAADIIAELPEDRKEKVIAEIEDEDHKADIKELLAYNENSAGGLMAKELVKVNENWNIPKCIKEMRLQANEVSRVHSIYVVDNNNVLKGRLSLKDLLVASTKAHISDIYIPKVDFVNINDKGEEVALIMQKYDLEAIPVVDNEKHLLGRITIDDIVDFIKEEAEKDYQMAAGITEDVEASDSIFQLTKARLPWLVLGLFGGLAAARIMGGFEEALNSFPVLFFFTPLIAAMAGNVGVQSSAIIVQGLANNNIKGSMWNRLVKEIGLSLINGVILALIVLLFGLYQKFDINISLTIALSLIVVIIISSLVGTFVPLILNKRGIDPAVATGPFITTSNDIFGIFIFFFIAKLMLGF